MVFNRKTKDASTDNEDIQDNSSSSTTSDEVLNENPNDLKRHNTNLLISPQKKIKLDFELFKSIDDLNEILSGFTLCLRIRNISAERFIKVANKSISIFHADGFDKAGHGIRIIFADAMVKKWESELDVNDVYKFAGFKLRPCNTDYNNLGSLYEIEVNKSTTIDRLLVDNPKVCPITQNFINLVDVEEIAAGQCIDVIGYITQIDEPIEVASKSSAKNHLVKTEIYIEDQTGRIMATFWNIPKDINYEVGSFIAIYGCNVNEFRNEKNLNVTSSTAVDVDADIEVLNCLKVYYENKQNRKKDKKKKNKL